MCVLHHAYPSRLVLRCKQRDGPRRTGDGYDESTIGDPDGNRLELTV
jgi:hypothetical protein